MTPRNPGDLPDDLPLECAFDAKTGLLTQVTSPTLLAALSEAYALGNSFGTPLDGTGLANQYCSDFLQFLEFHSGAPGSCLEVGAGTGYLARQMVLAGWNVTALEPGLGYSEAWRANGISVIPEPFPSSRAAARGPFDLVYSYGVLEHLQDPVGALLQMREHLRDGGRIVVAVPDCGEEVEAGDPSILVHEHLTYFLEGSLKHAMSLAGLNADVSRSNFGRMLYAHAHVSEGRDEPASVMTSEQTAETYPDRAERSILRVSGCLADLARGGALGVYAPVRGLALLKPEWTMRFFDDDKNVQGRFIPPFATPIESRRDLLNRPVEHLVILSRTFGDKIESSLRTDGYSGEIHLARDLT